MIGPRPFEVAGGLAGGRASNRRGAALACTVREREVLKEIESIFVEDVVESVCFVILLCSAEVYIFCKDKMHL